MKLRPHAQEHERQALQSLYSSSSLSKLQKDGLVLTELRGEHNGDLYRSSVWKFTPAVRSASSRGADKVKGGTPELPYHKFRVGDSVLITQFSTNGEEGKVKGGNASAAMHMEGTVLELRRGHLLVAVEGQDAEAMEEARSSSMKRKGEGEVTWRLDQSIRDTTAQRQIEAVKKLESFFDPDAPSEKLIRCVIGESLNGGQEEAI